MATPHCLDDVGRSFTWLDLRAFINYSGLRPGSAIAYVLEHPPEDPALVPSAADLSSTSERIAALRERLKDNAVTTTDTHNRRDRKQ